MVNVILLLLLAVADCRSQHLRGVVQTFQDDKTAGTKKMSGIISSRMQSAEQYHDAYFDTVEVS